MPTALAVVRLMTSSNLVGCSTRMSGGLRALENFIYDSRPRAKHIRRECPVGQQPARCEESHGRREWSADGPRTAIHQVFFVPKGCACKKQLTFPCQLDALGSDHMILSNLANFLHARARLNFRALYLGDQRPAFGVSIA